MMPIRYCSLFPVAHEVRRDVITVVHGPVQDAAELQDAITDAIDDKMVATDSRTAARINVATQTPALWG